MAVHPGDLVSGFTVNWIEEVPEFKSRGIYAHHEATGLQVFHLLNNDRENFFAFTFKTPPKDNTGAAHILEHSVLSGSERFPLKDPFVHLLKGSVQTFLNAMTYPDKTAYPAGSTVERDIFNLMLVYGDAVFSPLLKKEIFLQEGRRIEPDPSGGYRISGVVYNEMKGNYSDHESLLDEYSYRTLFPDTYYRFDSGGAPEAIPDLTYTDFVEYHRTYYHPGNCFLFLYGNIPAERYLDFLNEQFLQSYTPARPLKAGPLQQRWMEPKTFEFTSPLAPGEGPGQKTSITMNWMLDDGCDPKHLIQMEVLSEILFGNAGSPLTKAIVDSRLGEDVSPISGLDGQARQLVFSAGVRGSEPERTEAFQDCVYTELTKLREKGMSRERVEGALRRVEFRNREIRGGVPFGLRLFSRAVRGWLHGFGPLHTLKFLPHMEELKKTLANKPDLFEGLINTYLLENPHRATVTLRPDEEHGKKEEERERVQVGRLVEDLKGEKEKSFRKEIEDFRAFQSQEDRREDIEKLPFLKKEDLPKEVEVIPSSFAEIKEVPLHLHEVFTNGIIYLDLAFDCTDLGEGLQPYLPLFASALTSLGLPGQPYFEVAGELSSKTGGFAAFPEVNGIPSNPGEMKAFLFVRLKMLPELMEDAIALAGDLLKEADFSDHQRIWDILLEERNDIKSSVISGGHHFSSLRAASRLTKTTALEEDWKGISQLFHLEKLKSLGEKAGSHLEEVCRVLRKTLFTRKRLSINCTFPGGLLEGLLVPLESLIEKIPEGRDTPMAEQASPVSPTNLISHGAIPPVTREVLAVPSSVGFAALCLPASFYGTPGHTGEHLLAHLLSTDYLWREVRMKGGAYGAGGHASGMEGLFTLSSYRDPSPAQTCKIFSKAFTDSLKAVTIGDFNAAVTGLAGKELKPLAPGIKGFVGFRRFLYGLTDESRQQKRDQLLSMELKDLDKTAATMEGNLKKARWVVMADKQKGETALEELGGADGTTVLPL